MAEHRAVNADIPVRLRLVTPQSLNFGPLAERRGSGLLLRTTQVRILQGPPGLTPAARICARRVEASTFNSNHIPRC